MARPTTPLNLTSDQNEYLQSIVRSRKVPHSRVQRAQIILKAAAGDNNKKISQDLSLCEDTVGLWRRRWIEGHTDLSTNSNPKKLSQAIQTVLSDKERPGTPPTYTAEQICQIIALARTPPEPLTHWTREDLAREAAVRGIAEQISPSTIGRILLEPTSSPIVLNIGLIMKLKMKPLFGKRYVTFVNYIIKLKSYMQKVCILLV